MKQQISMMLMALLLLSSFQMVTAQNLDKKSLLAELNKSGNAKLSDSQKGDFDKLNQRYVDEFYELDKNAKTKEERDKGIDDLFDRRDKEIDGLFGMDNSLKDMKKELKKNTKGMRRKVKLAKLVL